MAKPQEKQSRSHSGRNGSRPTNQRYSASKRWVTNSAKRVARHLRVHGPLNHRRREYRAPTWSEVLTFLERMGVPEDTHSAVYKLVKSRVAA